ncbi:hypothetical protein [Listeria booriae]|uniref:hypothetical protein n=1 Tax=Listeria booriae TaxID=1552123 RepID=UPI0016262CD1|nr:hypothetical protein [Listeria booriae]MBC2037183.1 hypothetical protein [Listeria booriae]
MKNKKIVFVLLIAVLVLATLPILKVDASVRTLGTSYYNVYYRDIKNGSSNQAMTSAWFYNDYAYVEANSGNGTQNKTSSKNGSATVYGYNASNATFSGHWHYYE